MVLTPRMPSFFASRILRRTARLDSITFLRLRIELLPYALVLSDPPCLIQALRSNIGLITGALIASIVTKISRIAQTPDVLTDRISVTERTQSMTAAGKKAYP